MIVTAEGRRVSIGAVDCVACNRSTRFYSDERGFVTDEGLYECMSCGAVELALDAWERDRET